MNAPVLANARRTIAAPLRMAAAGLARGLELLVAPRGAAVLFAATAALLVCATWIRAPLDPGLSALHVPLASLLGGGPAPTDLLGGPRTAAVDSLGAVLLACVAVGAAILLWRPRLLSVFAGVLLVLAVAGNAMLACNQPGLIELLASQNRQRYQMGADLQAQKEDCLSSPTNGCVPYDAVRPDDAASPLRAWPYLAYGVWLAALGAAGVFYGGRRPLAARCRAVAIWGLLAGVAAAACCAPRLRAEYHWRRAAQLAAEADFAAAREALRTAVEAFGPLGPLRRTWLLEGQLDFEEGLSSPARELWTAAQLAEQQDLDAANAVMRQLAARCDAPAVAEQAADLLTAVGRQRLGNDDWGAAADAYAQAARAAPWRLDAAFYLGLIEGRCDRDRPQRAEARLARLVQRCADRGLRADLLGALGDNHFEAGKLADARRRYDQSFRLFNLPKTINYRAQKGLGGM